MATTSAATQQQQQAVDFRNVFMAQRQAVDSAAAARAHLRGYQLLWSDSARIQTPKSTGGSPKFLYLLCELIPSLADGSRSSQSLKFRFGCKVLTGRSFRNELSFRESVRGNAVLCTSGPLDRPPVHSVPSQAAGAERRGPHSKLTGSVAMASNISDSEDEERGDSGRPAAEQAAPFESVAGLGGGIAIVLYENEPGVKAVDEHVLVQTDLSPATAFHPMFAVCSNKTYTWELYWQPSAEFCRPPLVRFRDLHYAKGSVEWTGFETLGACSKTPLARSIFGKRKVMNPTGRKRTKKKKTVHHHSAAAASSAIAPSSSSSRVRRLELMEQLPTAEQITQEAYLQALREQRKPLPASYTLLSPPAPLPALAEELMEDSSSAAAAPLKPRGKRDKNSKKRKKRHPGTDCSEADEAEFSTQSNRSTSTSSSSSRRRLGSTPRSPKTKKKKRNHRTHREEDAHCSPLDLEEMELDRLLELEDLQSLQRQQQQQQSQLSVAGFGCLALGTPVALVQVPADVHSDASSVALAASATVSVNATHANSSFQHLSNFGPDASSSSPVSVAPSLSSDDEMGPADLERRLSGIFLDRSVDATMPVECFRLPEFPQLVPPRTPQGMPSSADWQQQRRLSVCSASGSSGGGSSSSSHAIFPRATSCLLSAGTSPHHPRQHPQRPQEPGGFAIPLPPRAAGGRPRSHRGSLALAAFSADSQPEPLLLGANPNASPSNHHHLQSSSALVSQRSLLSTPGDSPLLRPLSLGTVASQSHHHHHSHGHAHDWSMPHRSPRSDRSDGGNGFLGLPPSLVAASPQLESAMASGLHVGGTWGGWDDMDVVGNVGVVSGAEEDCLDEDPTGDFRWQRMLMAGARNGSAGSLPAGPSSSLFF